MTVSNFREHADDAFRKQISGVARDLEEMAKKAHRLAEYKDGDHGGALRDLIHMLMWGNANLNLDSVIRRQQEVDEAILEEETRPKE